MSMHNDYDIQIRQNNKKEEEKICKRNWMFFILMVVLIGGIIYLTAQLATPVAQIVSALIGFAGVITAAIFKFSIDIEKSRMRARHIEKQENYKKLLERIGKYIRNPEGESDSLNVAHIESWVFGSREVVLATNKFMKEYMEGHDNVEDLKKLLIAMREDVGLLPLNLTDQEDYDFDILFPKGRGLGRVHR